jgi:hypothetical protein
MPAWAMACRSGAVLTGGAGGRQDGGLVHTMFKVRGPPPPRGAAQGVRGTKDPPRRGRPAPWFSHPCELLKVGAWLLTSAPRRTAPGAAHAAPRRLLPHRHLRPRALPTPVPAPPSAPYAAGSASAAVAPRALLRGDARRRGVRGPNTHLSKSLKGFTARTPGDDAGARRQDCGNLWCVPGSHTATTPCPPGLRAEEGPGVAARPPLASRFHTNFF